MIPCHFVNTTAAAKVGKVFTPKLASGALFQKLFKNSVQLGIGCAHSRHEPNFLVLNQGAIPSVLEVVGKIREPGWNGQKFLRCKNPLHVLPWQRVGYVVKRFAQRNIDMDRTLLGTRRLEDGMEGSAGCLKSLRRAILVYPAERCLNMLSKNPVLMDDLPPLVAHRTQGSVCT